MHTLSPLLPARVCSCGRRAELLQAGRSARRRGPARLAAERPTAADYGELVLSEEALEQALLDAREELSQLFDEAVGMTGTVKLASLDGPFCTLRFAGRFWHPRKMVLARVGAVLMRRFPDLAEVNVEAEAQLDDSAASF